MSAERLGPLVVVAWAAAWAVLWAVAGRDPVGRHLARRLPAPVDAATFRARAFASLPPAPQGFLCATPLETPVAESLPAEAPSIVPSFARDLPLTDADGVPALTAGTGPAHGALPYRGPLPLVRTWACSLCRDGELRMSRSGGCAWCGHDPAAVRGRHQADDVGRELNGATR